MRVAIASCKNKESPQEELDALGEKFMEWLRQSEGSGTAARLSARPEGADAEMHTEDEGGAKGKAEGEAEGSADRARRRRQGHAMQCGISG